MREGVSVPGCADMTTRLCVCQASDKVVPFSAVHKYLLDTWLAECKA